MLGAQRCFTLMLLAAMLFRSARAFEIPEALRAGRELEQVLREAQIDFPLLELSHTAPSGVRTSANELMASVQRARIAIAQHVSGIRHGADESAVDHARRLQEELMRRVETHYSAQLQGVAVDKVEWQLHRGLADGVSASKQPHFVQNILRPAPELSELIRAQDETRFGFELRRLQAVLKRINPVSAYKRWKTRRLLAQISSAPVKKAQVGTKAQSGTKSQVGTNGSPTPWNIDLLRARLSSITALRSTQVASEASLAEAEAAAQRLETVAPIKSDLKLDKPPLPKKTKPKKIKTIKRPGWDGVKAPRRWAKTMHRVAPVDSWDDIPIPGMNPVPVVAH
jgi:hypothetical protein